MISERSKLRNLALNLIEKAGTSFRSGQFKTGHQQILEALETGAREPDVTKNAAAALILGAHQALATDLMTAEEMVAGAKAADPAVVVPPDFEKALHSARRDLDFKAYRSTAYSLEEKGSLTEALSRCRDFLRIYPSDTEATAIEDRLLKAKQDNENKRRREQQLSQLKSFQDQAKTVTHVENLLELLKRTKQIASQREVDADVTQVADHVTQVISAMAAIRKLMDQGRLDEAEALCVQSTAEFPKDLTFEQWRAEIELRRRERSAEYLHHVEQKLAEEPAFQTQEQILEAAILSYPQESFYAVELSLVRNKRLLLNAELARARDLESKELFEDALREWEGIRAVYPWYPNIDQDVERVRQIWISKTAEIRQKWLARINKSLVAGDVDTASLVLQEAGADLAGDPVLKDLQIQIENARQALALRRDLVSQAGEAFRSSRFENGIELFQSAAKLFPDDSSFRDWMLDVMLNEAKSVIQSDWQSSEILLNAIQQIRPDFPIPAQIPEAIHSKRKEARLVSLCEQVDRLAAAGTWDALREAESLLSSSESKYPGEARIGNRRQIISEQIRRLEIQQAREQARLQSLKIRTQLQAVRTRRQLSKVRAANNASRLSESTDLELRKFGEALAAEIDAKARELESAPRQNSRYRFWYVPVIAVVLGVLLGIFVHRKTAIEPPEVAKVEVPAPVIPVVQISGNVAAAEVYLDGARVRGLVGGFTELANLSNGSHMLRISSSEGEASISIFQDNVTGPRIAAAITASRLSVIAIASRAGEAILTTSKLETQTVLVDAKAVGSTAKGSLVLPALQAGSHQIQVGSPTDSSRFNVAVQARPSLYVLIGGSAPDGTLSVKTNVPGAELYINGKRYSAAGDTPLRLVLPAKTYAVYATREGYEDSEPAHVDLAKGSQVLVDLRLRPKPAKVELIARVPGTKVRLDDANLGELPVGKASSRVIPAGSHVFEISREGFVSKRLTRAIEPGRMLTLTGNDLDLAPTRIGSEAEDWNRARAGSLADLQSFQRQYPRSPHAQAAADRIQQLEWNTVDKTSSASLSAYITKYPAGSLSSEARRLREQLGTAEKSKTEQSEWDSLDKTKKDDLRTFVNKYPSGNHVSTAQRLLADFDKQQKVADQTSADDAAWGSVNRADRASLEQYARQFPSGKHINEAQQAVANLHQTSSQPDLAGVLAVLRRYAAAWSAKDLETILKLQPSLNRRKLKGDLEPVRVWRMSITPINAPQINGDQAEVTCRRVVDQVFANGAEKRAPESTVTFVLRKQGSDWIIEQVKLPGS